MTFNTGWKATTDIILFGKSISITVKAKAYYEKDGITSEQEAAFSDFSNNKELLEKVKYYLKNEEEGLSISNNGYYKCINKDYSYDNRIIEILEKVENL